MRKSTNVRDYDGNRKLKVAMLGHKHMLTREGGIEVVVNELSTRMARLGCDVTCFERKGHHVSGEKYDTILLKEYKGVRIKSVPTLNRFGLAAVTSSAFASIKAAFGDYDVVHYHAEGPCAMMWIPKLFGKRCIATVHGLDHKRAKWGLLARTYIRLGERCAARYADEVIVLSEDTRNYFKCKYNRDTKFLPNGISKPDILMPRIIQEEYGLEGDDYILFVGRLVPEKGIHYLIKAFRRLETDKKLVIVGGASGTEDYVREIKNMARRDRRIIFTGFVKGRVLGELYSNAYIYVLPSDLEGMPMSLLEAMSYGNCCVVSSISECAQVVKENAAVFAKGDVIDLENCLQDLIDDPDLVDGFRAGVSDFVCSEHDWDEVVCDTLDCYTSHKLEIPRRRQNTYGSSFWRGMPTQSAGHVQRNLYLYSLSPAAQDNRHGK